MAQAQGAPPQEVMQVAVLGRNGLGQVEAVEVEGRVFTRASDEKHTRWQLERQAQGKAPVPVPRGGSEAPLLAFIAVLSGTLVLSGHELYLAVLLGLTGLALAAIALGVRATKS